MSRFNPRRKNRKRRPYRGPRAHDATCHCHGACPWCLGNRTYQTRRMASKGKGVPTLRS